MSSSELAHSLRDAGCVVVDGVTMLMLDELLQHEPSTWGLSRQQFAAGSAGWVVHPYIRKFRGITTAEAYLERVDELVAVPMPVMVTHWPMAEEEPMTQETPKTIFLVHGHDNGLRHEVARFLERITSLQVVILHEQPDRSQTIIEKFERHAAEASCAVVLLTPDDAVMADGKVREHRARQNVVLELGYFMGALGRDRVCALYKEGVALPSDYAGVLYTKVNGAGAWKLKLATELEASGVAVDRAKLRP